MGQQILFSSRDGGTKAMKLHFSKSCIQRKACTSLIRHKKRASPLLRLVCSVHFHLEMGQLCHITLLIDWPRFDNVSLASQNFHQACIKSKNKSQVSQTLCSASSIRGACVLVQTTLSCKNNFTCRFPKETSALAILYLIPLLIGTLSLFGHKQSFSAEY